MDMCTWVQSKGMHCYKKTHSKTLSGNFQCATIQVSTVYTTFSDLELIRVISRNNTKTKLFLSCFVLCTVHTSMTSPWYSQDQFQVHYQIHSEQNYKYLFYLCGFKSVVEMCHCKQPYQFSCMVKCLPSALETMVRISGVVLIVKSCN